MVILEVFSYCYEYTQISKAFRTQNLSLRLPTVEREF